LQVQSAVVQNPTFQPSTHLHTSLSTYLPTIHSSIQPSNHPLALLLTHPPSYLATHSSTHPCTYPSTHTFTSSTPLPIHMSIHTYIHTCAHSHTPVPTMHLSSHPNYKYLPNTHYKPSLILDILTDLMHTDLSLRRLNKCLLKIWMNSDQKRPVSVLKVLIIL
jgi:hypothetical protein